MCPNPSGLTVAVLALALPAHFNLAAGQRLAVLESPFEPVKHIGQHRECDGAEGLLDLFLQVVDVRDGLRIDPILDVAPEAEID